MTGAKLGAAAIALGVAGASGCGGTRVVGSFTADAGADAVSEAAASGPMIAIHLRATTRVVAHPDAFAAQTPRDEYIGIQGLLLLASPTDPDPLVVFRHPTYVEARLNDGDDTVIARVPASSLRAGRYLYARTLVSHVRYKVDATVHVSNVATAGEYENLLVLSNDTEVGGKKRQSGDSQSIFRGAGQTFGPTEGKYALPPRWESAGIALEIDQGRASYVYPATLVVDPAIKNDVVVTFEVNMHQCFRWEDQPTAGYQTNVWDVELGGWEPVKQFGANAFTVRVE